MKGKFIVFEGLDRSGKSTMTSMVFEKLSLDRQAIKIGFPIRTSPIGTMINDFLTNKVEINNETLHLLFSANRWEAVKQIEQNLNQGKFIICDRYWYSGVAYSFAKGLNLEWCMAPDCGLIQPDLVVYLKGDPVQLASRSGYGNQRFEKVDFQAKVAQGFEKVIEKLEGKNFCTIDITKKTLKQVQQEVFQIVNDKFV